MVHNTDINLKWIVFGSKNWAFKSIYVYCKSQNQNADNTNLLHSKQCIHLTAQKKKNCHWNTRPNFENNNYIRLCMCHQFTFNEI